MPAGETNGTCGSGDEPEETHRDAEGDGHCGVSGAEEVRMSEVERIGGDQDFVRRVRIGRSRGKSEAGNAESRKQRDIGMVSNT